MTRTGRDRGTAATRAIAAHVEAHPGCSLGEVERATGYGRDWVRQALGLGTVGGKPWRLQPAGDVRRVTVPVIVVAGPAPVAAPAPVVLQASPLAVDAQDRELTEDVLRRLDAAGWSDGKIAARAGLPSTYVGRWREGVTIAAVETMIRLADAAGCRLLLVPVGGAS